MSWFKKDPPPPPPKETSVWIKFIIPLILAVFMGLVSVVYTGMASDIDKKADKDTIKQMIINQKELIENNHTVLQKHQDAIDTTLKELIKIKTTQEITQEKGKRKSDEEEVKKKETKSVEPVHISPEEFKEYLKLNKEERAQFRKLDPAYSKLPE